MVGVCGGSTPSGPRERQRGSNKAFRTHLFENQELEQVQGGGGGGLVLMMCISHATLTSTIHLFSLISSNHCGLLGNSRSPILKVINNIASLNYC